MIDMKAKLFSEIVEVDKKSLKPTTTKETNLIVVEEKEKKGGFLGEMMTVVKGKERQRVEAAEKWLKENPTLKGPIETCHGFLGKKDWARPKIIRYVDRLNRPEYDAVNASEYLDTDEVLREKVKMIADMIRKSENCIAYTGAGISTSSGISDYATVNMDKSSLLNEIKGGLKEKKKKKFSLLDARPTKAHRVLVSLAKEGRIKRWIQQNHDGLPQKAGMPQEHMNEIHGGWFDPTNRVVPMSGSLRNDLVEDMYSWSKKTDLSLVIGTSLAGMNADRCCHSPAKRAAKGIGFGSVIVSIQQTPHDAKSSVRVFAYIDKFAEMLEEEMKLDVEPMDTPIPCDKRNVFTIPYDAQGKLSNKSGFLRKKFVKFTTLDLNIGSKLMQTQGHFAGSVGTVVGRKDDELGGHWIIDWIEIPYDDRKKPGVRSLKCRRVMGNWWGETLEAGKVLVSPVVNV